MKPDLNDSAALREELRALYRLRPPRPARIPVHDPAFLAMNALERAVFLLAPELSGAALDVGCGSQPYRSVLETHCYKILACDYTDHVPGIDFACPADSLPLESQTIDALLCTEVLEHVPSPDAALAEFARVLQRGGKLLLSVPEYWPPHELPRDYFRFPRHGVVALLQRHGFELLRLVPRGGKYVFCGQLGAHAWQRWLSIGPIMNFWNTAFLSLDQLACSPELSLGWIALACKPRD
jgi:SAM-dependent methyltransferase